MNMVATVSVLALLVGCTFGATPTASDEVNLQVLNGGSLTFQCSGNTNSIMVLSASYTQPDTPTTKRKKPLKETDVIQPVAWCPPTSDVMKVRELCDAKTKCTIKGADPSKKDGCNKRPLKLRYKCVATRKSG